MYREGVGSGYHMPSYSRLARWPWPRAGSIDTDLDTLDLVELYRLYLTHRRGTRVGYWKCSMKSNSLALTDAGKAGPSLPLKASYCFTRINP